MSAPRTGRVLESPPDLLAPLRAHISVLSICVGLAACPAAHAASRTDVAAWPTRAASTPSQGEHVAFDPSMSHATTGAPGPARNCPKLPLGEQDGPSRSEHRRALERTLDALIETRGLEPVPAPPTVDPALRELGRLLNFDPILSGNRDIACATCHHPQLFSADARHLPRGTGGSGMGPLRSGGGIVPRNAPPLFNLHAYQTMFWDNRLEPSQDGGVQTPADPQISQPMRDTLALGLPAFQAMFPVTSHTEMRGQPGTNPIADAPDESAVWSRLMERILSIPEYRARFEEVYPYATTFNFAHAANAIAAFEIDAFALYQSPWQRYLLGDHSALTDRQLEGALDFFDAGCANCHNGPMFSDFQVHNTGLAQLGPGKEMGPSRLEDWGRMNVTQDLTDKHRFRTAPLINVELTAPYGHAGQFPTLRRFVEHYLEPQQSLLRYKTSHEIWAFEGDLWFTAPFDRAEIERTLDPEVRALKSFDPGAIVAFLTALTDPRAHDLSHELPATVPSGEPVETMANCIPAFSGYLLRLMNNRL